MKLENMIRTMIGKITTPKKANKEYKNMSYDNKMNYIDDVINGKIKTRKKFNDYKMTSRIENLSYYTKKITEKKEIYCKNYEKLNKIINELKQKNRIYKNKIDQKLKQKLENTIKNLSEYRLKQYCKLNKLEYRGNEKISKYVLDIKNIIEGKGNKRKKYTKRIDKIIYILYHNYINSPRDFMELKDIYYQIKNNKYLNKKIKENKELKEKMETFEDTYEKRVLRESQIYTIGYPKHTKNPLNLIKKIFTIPTSIKTLL